MWQDWVFTAGSLALCFTMIPILRAEHAPPWRASLPIAVILTMFALTYVTLGFVIAPVVEAVQALSWYWLTVRALRELHALRPRKRGVELDEMSKALVAVYAAELRAQVLKSQPLMQHIRERADGDTPC